YLWAARAESAAVLRIVRAAAVVLVATLATLTWRQTEIWHDSRSLWTRALELDGTSSIAHVSMATLMLRDELVDDAAEHARAAVAISPTYAPAHNDLGIA